MARGLGEHLNGRTFAQVLTSPLRRAVRTCELAGFGAIAEIEHDLVEWDHGEYEGRLSVDIMAKRPDWFRDGCSMLNHERANRPAIRLWNYTAHTVA
jgi:probable phosphoglycerate mutase